MPTIDPVAIDLRPTAMAAGGDAIARDADGRVVFVTGALPGEHVRVDVTSARRDYARGVVVDVLEPSSGRVTPPCPWVGAGCGGCQWQHIDVAAQREFKRAIVADALRRIARVDGPEPGPTVALPPTGYRTTVRAVVDGDRAGYRQRHSHDALAVDACLVAHPLVDDLIATGRYPGAAEVILRAGARTGERLAAPIPARARIEVPDDARRSHVHEIVAGRHWRISAHSFFQATPEGADALVGLVLAALDDLSPTVAVDLYSGVGLFAGVLAGAGWSVTAVEHGASAVADAGVNLRDEKVAVVKADVGKWRATAADAVVADPARSGLGRSGADVVAATRAGRVVLISCDPASMARDAGLLAERGYRLAAVTPVDLFPHTFHVETVSLFERTSMT
jgi:23S rRNA (uracil1939-C5)-methyltransferase